MSISCTCLKGQGEEISTLLPKMRAVWAVWALRSMSVWGSYYEQYEQFCKFYKWVQHSTSSGRFSSIVYLKSFANNFELFANNIDIYHWWLTMSISKKNAEYIWSRFISTGLQVHKPCLFTPLLKIEFLEDFHFLWNRDGINAPSGWTIWCFI